MEVAARVWVRDKDEAWVVGNILTKADGKVTVEVDPDVSEDPLTFTVNEADGIELEDLKLANDEEMDLVADLIQLPHLHEAAILHSLSERFERGNIYTFTANAILLAVNPFKDLPLYGQDLLQQYYMQGFMQQQGTEIASSLGPHVFAIADSAYRDMMQGIQGGQSAAALGPVNQSILISGESGAGKTESTKFVMKYLTTVGNSNGIVELEEGSLMERVLQSNPILEAFGNARTIRNDNSSRFGKFIELLFDKRGNLLGATIETYLLEKVRIPNQSPDERSFHIFYQMTKGASDADREVWALKPPDEYHYTNQGDCYDLSRVEDEEEFVHTRKAMSLMGFPQEEQNSILALVASLLHLGELEFEEGATEDCSKFSDDEDCQAALSHVCRLACLPKDGLEMALTQKTIEIGAKQEIHTIKLKPHQGYEARDALAKAIYGQLFTYVVFTINSNISCPKKDVRASIGVLDIFGFECFETNSFEQLCINYTNETLQQQFNQFVFKMEQKEYTREGIEWSFVEFPDNQDCLDLIEGKPQGLLAMLDDECRMGIRGTDKNYASRLYKEHTSNPRFAADAGNQIKLQFVLKHYAGPVSYTVVTFCDKNKDELPKESNELFASSSMTFLRDLFCPPESGSKKKDKAKAKPKATATADDKAAGKKPTVATQFKEQLHALMEILRNTRPHYIRCVKPNDSAQPDTLNRIRVVEQLRYGGVLEAVRVARSGFPVRLPHKDFYGRYRPLLSLVSEAGNTKGPTSLKVMSKKYPVHLRNETADNARKKCEELVKNVLIPIIERGKGIGAAAIQFGKTKVFLRKNAYDVLEILRSKQLVESAIRVQSLIRGHLYSRLFKVQRSSVITLQRVIRGFVARRRVRALRRKTAATRLQARYRLFSAYKKYKLMRRCILTLQKRHRGAKGRAVYKVVLQMHKAKKVQSWWRMAPNRRKYRRLRSAVIALQCKRRVIVARRVVKSVRAEAKDVGNLKKENDRLLSELLRLRAAAKANDSNKVDAAEREKEHENLVALMASNKDLTDEVGVLKARVTQLEGELQAQTQALQAARADLESAQKSLESAEKARDLAEQAAADARRIAATIPVAVPGAPSPRSQLRIEIEEENTVSMEQMQEEWRVKYQSLEKTSAEEIRELRNAVVKAEKERTEAEDMGARIRASMQQHAETMERERAQRASEEPDTVPSVLVVDGEEEGDDSEQPSPSASNLGQDDLLIRDLSAQVQEVTVEKRQLAMEKHKLEHEYKKLQALYEKALEDMHTGRGPLSVHSRSSSADLSHSGPLSTSTSARQRQNSNNFNMRSLAMTSSHAHQQHHYDHGMRSPGGKYGSGMMSPSQPAPSSFSSTGGGGDVGAGLAVGTHDGDAPHNMNAEKARNGTIKIFEGRLQMVKSWLRDGINVHVWDGRVKKVDAKMKLDDAETDLDISGGGDAAFQVCRLVFICQSTLFSRVSIKPLDLDQFLMIQQGSDSSVTSLPPKEMDTTLTLLQQPAGMREPDRIVVLKLGTESDCKELYSSIRKLLTEATVRRRESTRVNAQNIAAHNIAKGGVGTPGSGGSSVTTLTSPQTRIPPAITEKLETLEKDLTLEKENNECLLGQTMELSNDLNLKEEEVRRARMELLDLQAKFVTLQNSHKATMEVSAQHMKRIQNMQGDIDDLMEENEMLRLSTAG